MLLCQGSCRRLLTFNLPNIRTLATIILGKQKTWDKSKQILSFHPLLVSLMTPWVPVLVYSREYSGTKLNTTIIHAKPLSNGSPQNPTDDRRYLLCRSFLTIWHLIPRSITKFFSWFSNIFRVSRVSRKFINFAHAQCTLQPQTFLILRYLAAFCQTKICLKYKGYKKAVSTIYIHEDLDSWLFTPFLGSIYHKMLCQESTIHFLLLF